ncbi:MAG: hypothetical protein HHJ14_08015 [Cellulomonas sp.]|nr:hypothetical protein [Cellulomonas sp.]
MTTGIRHTSRPNWVLAFLASVVAVLGTLIGAAPATAHYTYDTIGYAYDGPALLSLPDTVATNARGSALGPRVEPGVGHVSLGGFGVAAEAASAELPPAVIGEGMASRVVPFAEEHGYATYPGLENPSSYTSEELLAHNRAQIDAWTGEGRTIIDVGPEPGRAFYPMETSPNYGMEHNLVRGYLGYQPMVLPGESDWWLATRVH